MMLKRLVVFLFIAAFGFATVQPAAGQTFDDADHTVIVDVDKIEKISASGDLNFEIGPAKSELNSWVSADETGTLTTTTNVHSPRKITVQAIRITSGESLGNIGLQVIPGASGEIDGKGTVDILGFNSSPNEGGYVVRDLTNSFETVYEESIDLDYRAKVNADYNPDNQTRLQVEYTLKSVSNQ